MKFLSEIKIPLEGGTALFYFLLIAFGGAVGWLLEYVRRRLEIVKLKKEIISITGTTLKDTQEARCKYIIACSLCTVCANKLSLSMINGESRDLVRDLRSDFCACLLEEVIPSYHSYTEWKHLQLYGSEKELNDLILHDVIFELRKFLTWLRVANRQELLQGLDQVPATVSKTTLSPFYQLTKGLNGKDLIFADEQLKLVCGQLLDSIE